MIKKNKLMILLIFSIISVITFSGCNHENNKKEIINSINKYYKPINNGNIDFLYKVTNIPEKEKLKSLTYLVRSMENNNSKVKNYFLKMSKKNNKNNKKRFEKMNKFIKAKKFQEFHKKLKLFSGNKEKFQKILLNFKNKNHNENISKKDYEMLFGGEILNIKTEKDYVRAMSFNIINETMVKPLISKFPKIGKFYVKKLLSPLKMKKIKTITLSNDKKTAIAEILLKNTSTIYLKLKKENNKWKVSS